MAIPSDAVSTGSGGAVHPSASTTHLPIRIDSNADFDAAHGVVGGNGSEADPWMIGGLEIDGGGCGYCIYIGNTTEQFAVRDCVLWNATGGDGSVFFPDSALALNGVLGGGLFNNTIYGSAAAVALEFARCVVMSNNTMLGCGVVMAGDSVGDWSSDIIDASNTVNGLPLRYVHDQNGGTVQRWAGQVILANCTGVLVEGLRPCGGSVGVALGFSSGNAVTNNIIEGNSKAGLVLHSSIGNIVNDNTIGGNGAGISAEGSYGNSIYNNNMIGNAIQVTEDSSENAWDGGYMRQTTVQCENATRTIFNCIEETEMVGQEIFQDELRDYGWNDYVEQMKEIADGNFTYLINATDLQTLDVRATGWADAPNLDLGIFLDGYGGNPRDGAAQWSECANRNFTTIGPYHYDWGYDQTAFSNDDDSDESIRLFHPPNGQYIVKVFGYNVSGSPGHFNLTMGYGRTAGAELAHGGIQPSSEHIAVCESGMSISYRKSGSDNNAQYVMDGTETIPWEFKLAHDEITSAVVLSLYGDSGTPSDESDDYWNDFNWYELAEGVDYSIDYCTGIVTVLSFDGWATESIYANYTYEESREMNHDEYHLDYTTGEVAFEHPLPPFRNELWAEYSWNLLVGGNYWSDWTGEDIMAGENQTETGEDGFVDSKYDLSPSSSDRYPLAEPRRIGVCSAVRINGDTDLDAAHYVSGGSGTEGDPWIIERLNIDGTGRGACVFIGNTTDHIVVRDSALCGASGNQGMYYRNSGILLYRAENVSLENNTMTGNECGVYLASSDSNRISFNAIVGNECGIRLEGSDGNVVEGNEITGNKDKGFEPVSEQSLGGFPPIGLQRFNLSKGYVEIVNQSVVERAIIPGVPMYLWYRGCSPTSKGMVVGYWDVAGYGRLVSGDASRPSPAAYDMIASPGNYYDYCVPMDDYPYLAPDKSELPLGDEHTSDSIADFSNISQSAQGLYFGWGEANAVSDEMYRYIEYMAHDYSVQQRTLAWGDITWEAFKAELDRGRPIALIVDCDGNGRTDHGSVAIGYGVTDDGVRVYACLNTWDMRYHWYVFGPMIAGRIFGMYSASFLEIRLGGWGVYLSQSAGNALFHNTIDGNTRQAFDDGGNRWDDGYPSGGNYWGAPHVADDLMGPGQNLTGPDGIGDAPFYDIAGPGRHFDEVANETVFGPASGGETGPFCLATRDLRNMTLYLDRGGAWATIMQGIWFDLNFQSGEITLAYPLEAGDSLHAFYNCTGNFVQASFDAYPLAVPYGKAQPVHEHFSIDVGHGWNLVSLPFEPLDCGIGLALSDLGGDTVWTRAMWYDPSCPSDPWKQFNSAWPYEMNDLLDVTASMGVWLYVTELGDGRIDVAGVPRNSTSMVLRAGWNLVGYPSLNGNTTVAVALWGTGADAVEVFDPAMPYMTRTASGDYVMRPGDAYWVHVPVDSVWIVWR
ncbi:MAG: NosD domain-containing protein [Methanobacteriota archaeon]